MTFSCLPPRKFSQKILRLPLLTKAKNMIIISLSKKSLWTFSPSCFQNCKIKFCSMILQFCRCGGGSNAKGHPDGFLSHVPSLRNFQLSVILTICVPPFLLYRKTPQSTTGKQAGPGALQRLILPLTFSGRHGIMGTR